jgi:chromosome segregation ATPase
MGLSRREELEKSKKELENERYKISTVLKEEQEKYKAMQDLDATLTTLIAAIQKMSEQNVTALNIQLDTAKAMEEIKEENLKFVNNEISQIKNYFNDFRKEVNQELEKVSLTGIEEIINKYQNSLEDKIQKIGFKANEVFNNTQRRIENCEKIFSHQYSGVKRLYNSVLIYTVSFFGGLGGCMFFLSLIYQTIFK